eukprot:gene14173-biopygen6594
MVFGRTSPYVAASLRRPLIGASLGILGSGSKSSISRQFALGALTSSTDLRQIKAERPMYTRPCPPRRPKTWVAPWDRPPQDTQDAFHPGRKVANHYRRRQPWLRCDGVLLPSVRRVRADSARGRLAGV